MITDHFVSECTGRVVEMHDEELRDECDLYRDMKDKGIKDELWLMVMEQELLRRELA